MEEFEAFGANSPQLISGADTTATTSQAMMNYIMPDSTVYGKLISEIHAGNLSALPKYDEVREHCPDSVACVKKTLRPCPARPNISPRRAWFSTENSSLKVWR